MVRTFAINTFGCKVNQYESQQIRQLLERLGLRQVDTLAAKPHLVVVNTCCITHTASAKSRRAIRRAQKLSPGAVTLIVGCLATAQTGELPDFGEKVHVVGHLSGLEQIVQELASNDYAQPILRSSPDCSIRPKNGHNIKHKKHLCSCRQLGALTAFKGHTRAFLKVQDGCDGHCTYCIIPKVRPVVRAKPAEEVVAEAQALVAAGHKEIVVTGVNLGAYGQSSVCKTRWPDRRNDKLAELLEEIAAISGLERIRLSSLEPGDVTDRLLEVFAGNRNIMPHLHLSLQSGSDAVLKRMARQYSAGDFLATVDAVKSRLDRPAITTDLIVGFPGETDVDFEQTVTLCERVGFAKMHVFAFSARKGTAAAQMQPAVDSDVTKKRSKVLRELDLELGRRFRQQFVGETAAILLENPNGMAGGRSERYFMVRLEENGQKLERNQLVTARLIRATTKGAIGRLC